MPVSDEAIRRHKRLLSLLRDRTSALLLAEWDTLEGVDDSDVETFTLRTAPTFRGAHAAAVAASSGFFALALDIRPVPVSPRSVLVEPDVRGPFTAAWHALGTGRPFPEAVQVGRSAMSATGFDFVQSTARRTGDVVAARSGQQVKWRRVPGGKSCTWCKTIAGQLYHSAESADFGHHRCDCDAVPA